MPQQTQQQEGKGEVQGTVKSLTEGLSNLLERLLEDGLYVNGDIRIDRLMLSTVNKAMALGLIPLGPPEQRVQSPDQLFSKNQGEQQGQQGGQKGQSSQNESGSQQGGQQS